jgi:hypothetical protein
MQRTLIAIGLIIVAAGLLWPWLSRLPFGRLPGDIHIQRDGFDFYFPLATGILVSLAITLLLWWLRK